MTWHMTPWLVFWYSWEKKDVFENLEIFRNPYQVNQYSVLSLGTMAIWILRIKDWIFELPIMITKYVWQRLEIWYSDLCLYRRKTPKYVDTQIICELRWSVRFVGWSLLLLIIANQDGPQNWSQSRRVQMNLALDSIPEKKKVATQWDTRLPARIDIMGSHAIVWQWWTLF